MLVVLGCAGVLSRRSFLPILLDVKVQTATTTKTVESAPRPVSISMLHDSRSDERKMIATAKEKPTEHVTY